jgi:mannonate dehydratase
MVAINWSRTSITTPTRGGALVTSYDHDLIRDTPLTDAGIVTEDQLWASLRYFLERVLPVAEQAGITLAVHPDDPPVPELGGIGQIMRGIENFQRLIELAPSPANGITFCQGNFALMTDDLPAAIHHFGEQSKIFFVHFRDVRGTPERFVECFHDDGSTDVLASMRVYKDIDFEGVLHPDYMPTMEGEPNDDPGYIRGLQEAMYGKRNA